MANSCGAASSPNGTEGFHFQLRPCTVHNFTGKARDSGNEDSSPAGTPSTTAAMARRGFRQFMPLDQSGSSRAMEVERLGSSGLFGTRTPAYGSDEERGVEDGGGAEQFVRGRQREPGTGPCLSAGETKSDGGNGSVDVARPL